MSRHKGVAPIANRVLGHNHSVLSRDRISENPLSNVLTDEVRRVTHADIVMLNTGGMRAEIPAGEVKYETFFRTLPFSNHGVRIGPLSLEGVLEILRHSAKTCGSYGAIMQSGLRVTYSRNCASQKGGVDPSGNIKTVELIGVGMLFDAAHPLQKPVKETFEVATFDFLTSGGDGYTTLSGVPLIEDYGILREALVVDFLKNPVDWNGTIDGRWERVK